MNNMKKRLVGSLVGIVGLAAVGSAGVALAANGDRVPSSSSGRTPAVSTDDRHGRDGRGEREPGDDRGRHLEQGDDRGHQGNEPGEDHGRNHGRDGENEQGDDRGHQGDDNRGPGSGQDDHGDNSGPGSDG